MPPVGYISTVASTAEFTVTRDELIRYAFEEAGVMPEEGLSPADLNVGISRLNMIVREVDQSGNWLWTVQEAYHLPLAASVGIYDANNGLPRNVSELVSVVYRSANGQDSDPLKILQVESYEEIPNKLETGEPRAVYLTLDTRLESRRLYVWPHLSTVTTQSKVVGSDNNIYKCVYPHTSTTTDKPVTGPNWRMVWEASSASVTAWASGTAYTTAESLRMVYKRPVFDFTNASQTPDFPTQCPRLLMLRLAMDIGSVFSIPQMDMDRIASKMKGSYADIFPSTRPKTNNIHNKVRYF